LNDILYAYYELDGGKLTFFLISIAKCVQSEVEDGEMRDAKSF